MTFDSSLVDNLASYPSLARLVGAQCEAYPRHLPFLTRRFGTAAAEDLRLCDSLSERILLLTSNNLDSFIKGYDFICVVQKQEEIYFRRNNAYRMKTVQDAISEVYGNRGYMQNYMRGLLMTQVFWSNHTASMAFYLNEFLALNPHGYDHLEIGPGHGLLLEHALADSRAASVTAWDISPASIAETRDALNKLGTSSVCNLEVRDIFEADDTQEQFDGVVFSEVLEHLEQPERALDSIRKIMRPGGRLYLNVPINSPAPDHIFLLRTPEEAVSYVQSRGFDIERTGFYAATNYSLDVARKHALTISVCLIAVKP